MKASELRINNLVNRRFEQRSPGGHNYVYSVCEVDLEGLERCLKGLSDYEPIPLTEEWLFKFGFLKNERGRWQIGGHSYALFWYEYIATGDDNRMWRIEYHCTDYGKNEYQDCHQMVDRITCVHQLQNLYFNLSGKELIYSE